MKGIGVKWVEKTQGVSRNEAMECVMRPLRTMMLNSAADESEIPMMYIPRSASSA
jgi:hypothetical protein